MLDWPENHPLSLAVGGFSWQRLSGRGNNTFDSVLTSPEKTIHQHERKFCMKSTWKMFLGLTIFALLLAACAPAAAPAPAPAAAPAAQPAAPAVPQGQPSAAPAAQQPAEAPQAPTAAPVPAAAQQVAAQPTAFRQVADGSYEWWAQATQAWTPAPAGWQPPTGTG